MSATRIAFLVLAVIVCVHAGFTSQVAVSAPLNNPPRALHLADLNLDGSVDVFCGYYTGALTWYPHQRYGAFGRFDHVEDIIGTLTGLTNIIVADVTGNGLMDLVATTNTKLAFVENAASLFPDWETVASGTGFGGIAFANISLTVGQEIVYSNASGVWYADLASGGAWISYPIAAGVAGHDLIAIDVDQDGDNDVVAITDNGLVYYRHSGAGTFDAPITIDASVTGTSDRVVPSSYQGALALAASSAAGIKLYQSNPSGGFLAGSTISAATDVLAMEGADLDNDGAMDLVIATTTDTQVLQNPNVLTTWTATTIDSYSSVAMAVADMDGDSDMDVVMLNASRNVVWHVNDHCASWCAAPPVNPAARTGHVTVGYCAGPATLGTTCSVGCATGFAPNGTRTSTCQGSCAAPSFTAITDVECSPVCAAPALSAAYVVTSGCVANGAVNSTCVLACAPGYVTFGGGASVCTLNAAGTAASYTGSTLLCKGGSDGISDILTLPSACVDVPVPVGPITVNLPLCLAVAFSTCNISLTVDLTLGGTSLFEAQDIGFQRQACANQKILNTQCSICVELQQNSVATSSGIDGCLATTVTCGNTASIALGNPTCFNLGQTYLCNYTSCDACISAPACGWCIGEQKCFAGSLAGPKCGQCGSAGPNGTTVESCGWFYTGCPDYKAVCYPCRNATSGTATAAITAGGEESAPAVRMTAVTRSDSGSAVVPVRARDGGTIAPANGCQSYPVHPFFCDGLVGWTIYVPAGFSTDMLDEMAEAYYNGMIAQGASCASTAASTAAKRLACMLAFKPCNNGDVKQFCYSTCDDLLDAMHPSRSNEFCDAGSSEDYCNAIGFKNTDCISYDTGSLISPVLPDDDGDPFVYERTSDASYALAWIVPILLLIISCVICFATRGRIRAQKDRERVHRQSVPENRPATRAATTTTTAAPTAGATTTRAAAERQPASPSAARPKSQRRRGSEEGSGSGKDSVESRPVKKPIAKVTKPSDAKLTPDGEGGDDYASPLEIKGALADQTADLPPHYDSIGDREAAAEAGAKAKARATGEEGATRSASSVAAAGSTASDAKVPRLQGPAGSGKSRGAKAGADDVPRDKDEPVELRVTGDSRSSRVAASASAASLDSPSPTRPLTGRKRDEDSFSD